MLASLERGFQSEGVEYQVNPRKLDDGIESVGVLSDLDALAAAIQWKSRTPEGRLLVGPNVVVMPAEGNGLVSAPEIDLLLVPSDWVRDRFSEEEPGIRHKLRIWAAGVDTDYWSPAAETGDAPGPHALIYLKELPAHRNPTSEEISNALGTLESEGFTHELVRYGHYSPSEFREALRRSDVMLVFTPTETQGMAILEAWSTGVPTLVAPVGETIFNGRTYQSSSAPYLTDDTGAEFATNEELARALRDVKAGEWRGRPRSWVLETMTDAAAARRYLDLARGVPA